MRYLDDFVGTETIPVHFSTHAAAGGNVAPLTAFEAADIRVYKDGSDVQRNTTAGFTMTSPFDGLTGFHLVTIDLGDNTDAGFYAAGHEYAVVLAPDTETVDGQTLTGVLLATFSIKNRSALRPATAGRDLVVSAGGAGDAQVKGIDAGKVDAAAIAQDAIDADSLKADAVAEIQAGLALEASVQSVKGKTDNLPADPADASDVAASFASIASTLATIAAYVDTEVAAILAAVDTEVAAIKAKTDNLPASPANEATATAIKAKTDLIPASPAATGDAMTLTSGERDAVAAALLDLAAGVEAGLTVRQGLRLALAALAGKLSGAGTTTEVFRNAVADSKPRITATVDAAGNRSAITTDLS